jgi:hypothetical protein
MKVYRFFAYFIAAEVVIQASAIAFALFGLGKWIEDDGGVLNKAVMDADKGPEFTGVLGFAVHGINGMMVIPLLALIFLVVSFFAKVASGTKWASIVLLLVIVQVALGMTAHSVPALGPLHAINAFAILAVALYAGRHAGVAPAPAPASPRADATAAA